MRAHDFGLWIQCSVWNNGKRDVKYFKPEEFTYEDLKELRTYQNADILMNGKRISSLRKGKFFWVEDLPYIYSSQKSRGAHLSSKVNGEVERFEDMNRQLTKLIHSLEKTKEVIGHMKAHVESED